MKKFVSVLMSCCMCCALLGGQSLAVDVSEEYQSVLSQAEQYAYIDPDTVSPELKEKILEARNKIIFSKDWVADGLRGCITDVETGEVLKELPTFSSVFPDWELPFIEPAPKSENTIDISPATSDEEVTLLADITSWLRLGSYETYLNAASSENADPFISFTMNPFSMGTSYVHMLHNLHQVKLVI